MQSKAQTSSVPSGFGRADQGVAEEVRDAPQARDTNLVKQPETITANIKNTDITQDDQGQRKQRGSEAAGGW